jgi:hypothetical protein
VDRDPVAVIGAGPYGLSVAAHLKARNVPTLIFGKTMEFWQGMPPQMYLKSVWSAATLRDGKGDHTLSHFAEATGSTKQDPIPLPYFLNYGKWYQEQVVPDVDPCYVERLAQDGPRFRLEMADGRTVMASRVVLAVGIGPFPYVPETFRNLPDELVSHTMRYADLAPFKGKSVAVVGHGQSALEWAAMLYEVGAQVEVLARDTVIWIDRKLYRYTGPAKHIFYPSSDVGPPGLNWLIAFPQIFRRLSDETRYTVDQRAIRPAGATWLRHRVDGVIQITESTAVTKATPSGDRLTLALSDGTSRTVDHVFCGTGFKPDVSQIGFLDEALVQRIQAADGLPILTRSFESSVPNLHFVGALANFNFGPICRFVAGAKVSAPHIAARAARVA